MFCVQPEGVICFIYFSIKKGEKEKKNEEDIVFLTQELYQMLLKTSKKESFSSY